MIKKILISQPEPTSANSPYYDIAKRHNVEIVFRPFIKVEPLTPKEFRAQKISILDHTAVVFTSRLSIDNFFLLAKEMRVPIPEDMKYFCITETVAQYIQKYVQYRKRKVFFGTTGKIDDLLPTMLKHKNERYFIPLSDVHNPLFSDMLDSKNLFHSDAIMYRTVSNDFAEGEPFDYDMLIFFSPSGVQSLKKNFPDFKQGDIVIGTLGPATAKAVRDAGLRLDIEAPSPQYPSISAEMSYKLSDDGILRRWSLVGMAGLHFADYESINNVSKQSDKQTAIKADALLGVRFRIVEKSHLIMYSQALVGIDFRNGSDYWTVTDKNNRQSSNRPVYQLTFLGFRVKLGHRTSHLGFLTELGYGSEYALSESLIILSPGMRAGISYMF